GRHKRTKRGAAGSTHGVDEIWAGEHGGCIAAESIISSGGSYTFILQLRSIFETFPLSERFDEKTALACPSGRGRAQMVRGRSTTSFRNRFEAAATDAV